MKASAQRIWKLRHWIILGYSVPVVALVISAAVTVANVRQVRHSAAELHSSWEVNDNIGELDSHIQAMSRTTRGYLLEKSPVSLNSFNAAKEAYTEVLATTEEWITNEQQLQNLKELEVQTAELIALNEGLIALVDAGQPEEAINAWKADGGRGLAESISALLLDMETLEHEIMAGDEAAQTAALGRLQTTLLLAAAISVLVSVLLGTWIVLKASRLMNQSAGVIASSANEIAASIEQQERTSSQQAASVSETTTTMDELGASSRQSAEQAEAAAAGAQQALKLAEEGTRAVERSMAGMGTLREKVEAIADQILRLSEQTNQIGGISGLVSDLANQTNMLALNAAVEAVRAGEHGKGFAVVSGEIRKLADQSKKSAEKINALVADIQTAINSTVMVTDEGTKTVEEGVKISEETAAAFGGVADAVNNVVLNSQQISLNVKQQAVAIEQVVSAMNNLNKGAQETASGITQIRTGTHQLNESAMQLKVAI
ncbi:HAMP domain-containing methyl-accepting chemotaxis protein [Leptolyngbya iicbica]|uniref:Methyl-accepting chemotaxis protein n=2 Tax=Cyanophyceae TaxID=3028117 RepID=A0A4Q7EFK1_9CYAN|nr:methyl-accepting chemotaxis protein [Leptolyngbya sp. LK]RZM81796.1 methyl-accepting chemotaxis protein [Leptolyngbya sp. LK]